MKQENTPDIKLTGVIDTDKGQEKKKKYYPLLNSNATNQLTAVYLPQQLTFQFDAFNNEVKYKRGFSILLDPNNIKDGQALVGSTSKLLDILTLTLTQQINQNQKTPYSTEQLTVSIPLTEYTNIIGKDGNNRDTVKNVRKQVVKDLKSLYWLSLRQEWDDNNRKLKKPTDRNNYFETRILTSQGVVNGNIYATFATPLVENVVKCGGIAQYPKALAVIPTDKTTLTYVIGRKLALQHSNAKNIASKTNNIICMDTLIKWATDNKAMRSEDELKQAGQRNFYRLIIEPIEKALDTLQDNGVITSWAYTKSKSHRLTDSETSQAGYDYRTVREMFITFTMPLDEEKEILDEGKGG